ncbi:MAG: pyridoxamine 5'-phosphate oxidase family protein [Plesiomonas sp.]|uniref:pyridoxamine 5'-phosphate oxidase family protein n=1 Tax=Plesiomonas sp. TaxID=2486279 RepID=UPI003F2F9344
MPASHLSSMPLPTPEIVSDTQCAADNTAVELAVANYLATHQVLALSIQDQQGLWSAPVYYAASSGSRLIFLSRLESRHAQAVLQNPHVALSIYTDSCRWNKIQGLQGVGSVRLLEQAELDLAKAQYLKRFNFILQDEKLLQSMAKVSWFMLDIEQLFWLDNQAGLGQRIAINVNSPEYQQAWNVHA